MSEPIVIAGAGSIGCFVGGLLALGGREVTLLGRPRILDAIAAHGLSLTSFEGWREDVSSDRLRLEVDPARALAEAGLVIVTVKSGQTEEMARAIAAHAPKECAVISLQNGLDNAARLRTVLGGGRVFGGMVSFNVVDCGGGRFHRGTSGPIVVEAGAPMLAAPHLAILSHPRIEAVLAGKLIYNLNNALNALSGLPLRQQLGDRRWRRILAACQDEALGVFAAKGIEPWSLGGIAVRRFPAVLRLPDWLFRLVARRGVRIDAEARSSMWDDLVRGRRTEIDELQGRVVAMAEELGLKAPANALVRDAVREAERRGGGAAQTDPDTLLSRIKS